MEETQSRRDLRRALKVETKGECCLLVHSQVHSKWLDLSYTAKAHLTMDVNHPWWAGHSNEQSKKMQAGQVDIGTSLREVLSSHTFQVDQHPLSARVLMGTGLTAKTP